jgi:hypothetical protein
VCDEVKVCVCVYVPVCFRALMSSIDLQNIGAT